LLPKTPKPHEYIKMYKRVSGDKRNGEQVANDRVLKIMDYRETL